MFREKYIKDNELIKPDEDFLRRLKETVQQEVVQIGDYVDYDNAESFERIGGTDATVMEMPRKRSTKSSNWKSFSLIAACFVLVCTIAFAVGKTGVVDGDGLQAGVELAFSEKLENTSGLSEECIETYNEVCGLFAMRNVVIYEMDSYMQDGKKGESLEMWRNRSRELDKQEEDELVSDILANKYNLVATMDEVDSVMYYLAEFENQTCVLFAIDSQQIIYIVDVLEM